MLPFSDLQIQHFVAHIVTFGNSRTSNDFLSEKLRQAFEAGRSEGQNDHRAQEIAPTPPARKKRING